MALAAYRANFFQLVFGSGQMKGQIMTLAYRQWEK